MKKNSKKYLMNSYGKGTNIFHAYHAELRQELTNSQQVTSIQLVLTKTSDLLKITFMDSAGITVTKTVTEIYKSTALELFLELRGKDSKSLINLLESHGITL